MSIKSKIRTVENYPIEGIMFRDITSLLSVIIAVNSDSQTLMFF